MTVTVTVTEAGLRLDRAVHSLLLANGREVSMQEIRRALKDGHILIDGRPASPGARTHGGEIISFEGFVARIDARIAPDTNVLAKTKILYEDTRLLALSKPSGVPTAPLKHDEAGTLLGAAIAHVPSIAIAGPPLEGGLVHRLDKGTSGVVLFAKDDAKRAELRAAFKQGAVQKRYRALAHDPEKAAKEGLIMDLAILPSGDHVRAVPEGTPGSLSALSEIVKREDLEQGWCWIEIAARSGRRHQIRAHLASIGVPIAGDDLYGGAPLERLGLHASWLRLPEGLVIEAPLSEDLAAAVAKLR